LQGGGRSLLSVPTDIRRPGNQLHHPAVRRLLRIASALCLALGCGRAPRAAVAPRPTPSPAPPPAIAFEEKSAAMGIDFTHVTGAAGQKWMPETMGGGVAVIDYDGDGRPDLLFVSGAFWPGDERAKAQKSSLALFRNEDNGPDGAPRFRNTTREAGLERVFYGMGASVADFDNDGRDDLYVTALNRNLLFRNLGGRFEEVAARAGVRESGWGTSSAWLDYDGDGLLDLYVCRYVDTPDRIEGSGSAEAGRPPAKASADLAPGDELHLAGLHVANPALDLLGPGRLDTLFGRLVQAARRLTCPASEPLDRHLILLYLRHAPPSTDANHRAVGEDDFRLHGC
jgi:hypothetical protein